MFLSRCLKYVLLLQAKLAYFELQTKYCGAIFLPKLGKVKQLRVSDLRNLQCHLKLELSLLLGHKEIWLYLHCHVHGSGKASLKGVFFFHSLTSSILLHMFLKFFLSQP